MASVEVEPSILRLIGRRSLRKMRPLALPFLHRFQCRVQTAIQLSAEHVNQEIDRVRHDMVLIRHDVALVRQDVAEQTATQAAILHRLDALSSLLGDLITKRSSSLNELDVKLKVMQIGIDAVRLDQADKQQELEAKIGQCLISLEKAEKRFSASLDDGAPRVGVHERKSKLVIGLTYWQ
ncbi:hypothetical protein [Roseomonas xinghualingensis]|uniref:hypothetical protein n=1 Tax=Roseomonas xinghualingensis TaxID=2986475 RepID=UPI0021F101A2|nr:hypothetical protein [Roseomonas sp. SXEYE001]MCV4210418.1 hypothetical protein [Roseomonas sp. SXEYE001]